MKATVDATAMPALKPVVCTVGTGSPEAGEEVAVAAAAVSLIKVAESADAGAGEHFPNPS